MKPTEEYTLSKNLIYLRDDPRTRMAKGVKPIISFEGCEIARSSSAWVTKTRSDGTKNEYRTEFVLYRSDAKYYLNILGRSNNESDQVFSRVIEFITPTQCMEIIEDEEDDRLYLSEPVVALLLEVTKSSLIDSKERSIWINLITSKE